MHIHLHCGIDEVVMDVSEYDGTLEHAWSLFSKHLATHENTEHISMFIEANGNTGPDYDEDPDGADQ